MVRFTGTAWQQVALPTANDYGSDLTAVDATAAANVWAVGTAAATQTSRGVPLILKRTNGVWGKVAAPASGAGWNWLYGLDMISPSSGWAVGSYQPSAATRDASNLILRWNGSVWTPIPAPGKAFGVNKLTSVTADGPNSAWAVGSWAPADQEFSPKETVVLRWNGSTWTRWPSPSPSPDASGSSNTLNNVISISPAEAWATGQTSTNGWMSRRPLNLHWTGGAWTEVTAPVNEPLAWEFTDAYAVSPVEVYFVGYKRGVWDFQDHDFIRRWDGTKFVPETLGMPANGDGSGDRIVSAMGAVTGLPNGQLWAVGHVQSRTNHVLTKNANP
jgi:hypothetical protein